MGIHAIKLYKNKGVTDTISVDTSTIASAVTYAQIFERDSELSC